MEQRPCFTPELFRFLRELGDNNRRDWFEEHQQRYLDHVRDPLLQFIADLAPHLAEVSPHVAANARPVGGSMFRIERDTRFARDKSPYKAYAAARFVHRKAKKGVTAPGFYLALMPSAVNAAAGVRHPDGAATLAIRRAIVDHTAEWRRIHAAEAFRSNRLQPGGNVLKRPPRGFDAGHPCVEDLKRKDFFVWTDLGEAAACAPDFLMRYVGFCRSTAPYVGFLARALGQPF